MHIWKNFIKQWKNKETRGVVWECAKSKTIPEFTANMEKLNSLNERAWEYLSKIQPEAWVKAYFSPYPKVDGITNNNCEVWNAKILKYRNKPILTMLEELRCYVMRKQAAHKKALQANIGKLAPVQQQRLEKEKLESNKWTPQWSGDERGNVFEVSRFGNKVKVDLSISFCTCNFWQISGMPCHHAIAAIAFKNQRPEDFVHYWLTNDALHATYSHSIVPVNGMQYWNKCDSIQPVPPKIKRPVGRPKKHRKKDGREEAPGSGYKVKRKYEVTCYKCGQTGHYPKTCKGSPLPNPKAPRRKRARQIANEDQEEIPLTQSHPQPDNNSQVSHFYAHFIYVI